MLLSNISLMLAYGLSAVQASRTFSNPGTKSGWDKFTHEDKGTVEEVKTPVYKGDTALQMTQIYDKNWSGRYHSEAVKTQVYKRGDSGFYGFAFQLPKDWEFTQGLGFNLAQFIADFSDAGCEEHSMPSTMVWIVGNKLATRVKHGSVCPTSKQKTTNWTNLATVTAGEWHTVILQVKWESDNTGLLRLWFDGKLVKEAKNIATTVDNDKAFDFRAGLYANAWHDKGYSGNQATRQVYYDSVAIGTSQDDVDPTKW